MSRAKAKAPIEPEKPEPKEEKRKPAPTARWKSTDAATLPSKKEPRSRTRSARVEQEDVQDLAGDAESISGEAEPPLKMMKPLPSIYQMLWLGTSLFRSLATHITPHEYIFS